MLATLLGAIRADIDRQVAWARGEVGRQLRYTALTGALAAVAVLAAVGAIIVGLIAFYRWLATQTDPFIALGMIGGSLLLLGLILLALAFIRRRPRHALRPQLQIARPAALLSSPPPLKLVTETVRHGSRAGLLGFLVLVAAIGLVIGRRV
jgi:high-affinity Fe2+/Pb2+ permease